MLRCVLFLVSLIGVYVYLIFRDRYKLNNQRNKDDIALNTTSDELKRLIDKYGNSKVKHAENILNLDIEKDLDGVNYRIRNNHDYLTQSIPQDVIDKLSNYLSSRSSYINNNENKENIKQYKYCPQCGKRVLKSAHFCENCGYKFSATDIYNSASQNNSVLNSTTHNSNYLSNNLSSNSDYFSNVMRSLDAEIDNSSNNSINNDSKISMKSSNNTLSNTSKNSNLSVEDKSSNKRANDNHLNTKYSSSRSFKDDKHVDTPIKIGAGIVVALIILILIGAHISNNSSSNEPSDNSTEQPRITPHEKAEHEANVINNNSNDVSEDENGVFDGASVSGNHVDVDFNASEQSQVIDVWDSIYDDNGDYEVPVNLTMQGETFGTTYTTDENIDFDD